MALGGRLELDTFFTFRSSILAAKVYIHTWSPCVTFDAHIRAQPSRCAKLLKCRNSLKLPVLLYVQLRRRTSDPFLVCAAADPDRFDRSAFPCLDS
jgi:hypothetical protein